LDEADYSNATAIKKDTSELPGLQKVFKHFRKKVHHSESLIADEETMKHACTSYVVVIDISCTFYVYSTLSNTCCF